MTDAVLVRLLKSVENGNVMGVEESLGSAEGDIGNYLPHALRAANNSENSRAADIVRMMLAHTENNQTMFHDFFKEKCTNHGVFCALIDQRSAINSLDCEGNTPLHLAVQAPASPFVEKLFVAGALPNRVNLYGQSILATADSSHFSLLFKHGAKLQVQDISLLSDTWQKKDTAKVNALLQRGAAFSHHGINGKALEGVDGENCVISPLFTLNGKRITHKTAGFEKAILTAEELKRYLSSLVTDEELEAFPSEHFLEVCTFTLQQLSEEFLYNRVEELRAMQNVLQNKQPEPSESDAQLQNRRDRHIVALSQDPELEMQLQEEYTRLKSAFESLSNLATSITNELTSIESSNNRYDIALGAPLAISAFYAAAITAFIGISLFLSIGELSVNHFTYSEGTLHTRMFSNLLGNQRIMTPYLIALALLATISLFEERFNEWKKNQRVPHGKQVAFEQTMSTIFKTLVPKSASIDTSFFGSEFSLGPILGLQEQIVRYNKARAEPNSYWSSYNTIRAPSVRQIFQLRENVENRIKEIITYFPFLTSTVQDSNRIKFD